MVNDTLGGMRTLVLTIMNFNQDATYVCRTMNIAGIDAGIVALQTGGLADTMQAFLVILLSTLCITNSS